MTGKSSAFAALQYNNLRIFLTGLFLSSLGSMMQTVAVGWHVYELSHSVVALGFLGVAGFLPILLAFLPGGTIADSLNRKWTLVVVNVLFTLGAVLLGVATVGGWISIFLIYAVLALNALLVTVDLPARSAVVPLLVPKEHIYGAVSLNTLFRQTASVLGPALAGGVIALYGVQTVYLLNALSFAIMIGALLLISIPPLGEKKPVISHHAIWEGIHFILHSPLLYATMLLDFFVTFLAGAIVLLPVFAKDILHVGVSGLGLMYAAPSVGAVLAGFFFSSLGQVRNQGKILFAGILVYAVAMIGFGLSQLFLLSLFFLMLSGAGDMISTLIRNALRQMVTPDEMRGRMTAISMVFFIGGPFLGDSEAGFMAGFLGAPLSVVTGGLAAVLFIITVFWKVPSLRKYQGTDIIS